MDRPVRKFILWKCRNPQKLKYRLSILKERMEDILEESSGGIDGQPKPKHTYGDIVSTKAVRREHIEYAINKIEYELKTIEEFRKELTGWERTVYDETIAKESDLTAKADFLNCGKNKLCDDRATLLRELATRLGEFIDEDE